MQTIITNKEIIIGEVLDFTYGDGIPTGTIIKEDLVVIPQGTQIQYGPNPYNDGDLIILDGQEIDVEADTIQL